jgi:4-hydroxy-tetrahydrodipicolinate synthase
MMAVGAVGVVSVVSNIVPGRVSEMCAAWLAGRQADALAIHRDLLPLMKAIKHQLDPANTVNPGRFLGGI